jgi:DnaJ like chaperone protein
VFGPIGGFLGLLIGHSFDKGLKNFNWGSLNAGGNQQAQQLFFNSSFAVMGYVAKSNGRVSEKQIQLARAAMKRMGLHGERGIEAMRQFKQGTHTEFDLDHTLALLQKNCRHAHLLQIFIELQVQTAYADGPPSSQVKTLLQRISQRLGLGVLDFAHVEAMLYGNWRQQSQQSHRQHYQQSHQPPRANIHDAYSILGVTKSAEGAEVKKAYRRKMNENHPDKLISKGLPKEMIDVATEKTQQIKAAYEQIKQARGMK